MILAEHGLQVTESLSTCTVHTRTQMHLVSVDLPSGFSLTALTEHSLPTCHHQEYHVL